MKWNKSEVFLWRGSSFGKSFAWASGEQIMKEQKMNCEQVKVKVKINIEQDMKKQWRSRKQVLNNSLTRHDQIMNLKSIELVMTE